MQGSGGREGSTEKGCSSGGGAWEPDEDSRLHTGEVLQRSSSYGFYAFFQASVMLDNTEVTGTYHLQVNWQDNGSGLPSRLGFDDASVMLGFDEVTRTHHLHLMWQGKP